MYEQVQCVVDISRQHTIGSNTLTHISEEEQREKLDLAQDILGYRFENEEYLLSAITHPSAVEGKPVKYSYERLEFLGDSILGGVVADAAFHAYPDLDEGGLTRIKVSLVSGSSLSQHAEELGFADFIIFGQSEQGTGKRGLHSALENVYESIVAALYLDGGMEPARNFIKRTLITAMSDEMAKEPENPKSALQEKLQEEGITPTYKLVETQGPPHDRTFITQVYAGIQELASGVGRTKKESESQAAASALDILLGTTPEQRMEKEAQKAARQEQKAQAKAAKAAAKAARAAEKKSKKDAARSGQAQG